MTRHTRPLIDTLKDRPLDYKRPAAQLHQPLDYTSRPTTEDRPLNNSLVSLPTMRVAFLISDFFISLRAVTFYNLPTFEPGTARVSSPFSQERQSEIL